MALAVGISMLIHALVAYRLLYAPVVAPLADREMDAPITMLFYTPAPPAAAPAVPEAPVPAEPPPPAVVAEPPPREVAPDVPPAPPPPAALAAPMPTKPVDVAPKSPVRRPAPLRPAPHPHQEAPSPVASSPPRSMSTTAAEPGTLIPARPIRGSVANRDPAYPDAARRRGEQGRVMLRVNVTPLQSCGFPRLDDAAVAAVRQWRFEPAERNGKPVEGAADVPILFRLGNRPPDPSESVDSVRSLGRSSTGRRPGQPVDVTVRKRRA